jgi:LmbE family N-acetylglucosaminyl deacetylase
MVISYETFGKWGHENVLGDYVRVIRRFHPEIIISAFTGTPADSHGHHQVSGIVTQDAFKAEETLHGRERRQPRKHHRQYRRIRLRAGTVLCRDRSGREKPAPVPISERRAEQRAPNVGASAGAEGCRRSGYCGPVQRSAL